MAQIVGAWAVTHSAVMVRTWERASTQIREEISAGYKQVRDRLLATQPDLVILIGNDHYQSFFLDNMPAFCLGIGDHSQGWGEADIPPYRMTIPRDIAETLLDGLLARNFDIAFARNLPLDHSFMTPIHLLMPEADIPIIPLFQNCLAPPLPALARCLALGQALQSTLEQMLAPLRVALIATGGLSHEIPLPDWRDLGKEETAEKWLKFMSQGRYQADRDTQKAIGDEVLRWGKSGGGRIDEDFDREILQLLSLGRYQDLARYDTPTIRQRAGNGAQELRNWATAAGACGGYRAEQLFYRAVPEWLTGVAGVDLRASQTAATPTNPG